MAGPETKLARAVPDIDIEQAMADATAPGMQAIQGQQQFPTSTTGANPSIPDPHREFQLQVQDPGYAWKPTQEDLGQQDVAQYNFDTGLVPVARRGNALGAIASRQAFNAERRAQAEMQKQKAMRAFNPFGEIGDAAAPYQAAYGKYVNDDWNREIQAKADAMFGGDTALAYDYIVNDPEGQRWAQGWAMQHDRLAKENKGTFDMVGEFLADVASGEVEPPDPETLKMLTEYYNGNNMHGVPVMGTDPGDFKYKGRNIERAISRAKYTSTFLKDFDNFGEQMMQMGKAQRLPGGKWTFVDESRTTFDELIDYHAGILKDYGTYKSKEDAAADLKKIMKDRVEWKRTTYAREQPKESGSEGANKGAPVLMSSVVKRPARTGNRMMDGPVVESLRVTPYQETGDKKHKIAKMNVVDGDRPVDLYAPGFEWDEDAKKFVFAGISLNASEEAILKNKVENEGEGLDKEAEFDIEEYVTREKLGKLTKIDVDTNGDAMQIYFQTRDPYEVVAMQLRDRGVDDATAEIVAEAWKTLPGRKKLINELR